MTRCWALDGGALPRRRRFPVRSHPESWKEEGRHRELAEKAREGGLARRRRKRARRGGGAAGRAVGSEDALADAKGDLDDTSDAYARLSQALASSEPLIGTSPRSSKNTRGQGRGLAKAEAETEKRSGRGVEAEESVVAERRGAVEGAADRSPPCAEGATPASSTRRVDGVGVTRIVHRDAVVMIIDATITLDRAGRRGRASSKGGRRAAAQTQNAIGRVPSPGEEESRRSK